MKTKPNTTGVAGKTAGSRRALTAAAAMAASFLASCFGATEATPAGETDRAAYQRISPDEAQQRMGEPGTVVLDVRTPGEYAAGRIPGAVLIPLAELRNRAREELPDPDTTILVYCRTGNRSSAAARQLIGMGYQNVYDFGGIIHWRGETVR